MPALTAACLVVQFLNCEVNWWRLGHRLCPVTHCRPAARHPHDKPISTTKWAWKRKMWCQARTEESTTFRQAKHIHLAVEMEGFPRFPLVHGVDHGIRLIQDVCHDKHSTMIPKLVDVDLLLTAGCSHVGSPPHQLHAKMTCRLSDVMIEKL